jgi:uncharacterized protein YkwD
MNWIDLLLIVVLLLAVWGGWQRGFIGGTLSLVTWAGSFVAGFYLYPFAAALFSRAIPSLGNWTNAVAFISMVVLARILLNGISRLVLRQTAEETHRHAANKALGLLPGIANGLIQVAVIAALLLAIPFENRMTDAALESQLANRAAPPAFWLMRELAPVFSEPLKNAVPKPVVDPDGHETVKLPFKVSNPKTREDLEAKMLALVNEERRKEGLKLVAADPEMQEVARAHSRDMFKRRYFAHVNPDGKDPFERMRKAGVKFRRAGENLALAQTLQQAHEGLMKSPGHRANILQPQFGRLGIGILDGGIYGLMVTQNFRN